MVMMMKMMMMMMMAAVMIIICNLLSRVFEIILKNSIIFSFDFGKNLLNEYMNE